MGCLTCNANQKWCFLFALAIATLTSSFCSSIQAPFYPHEAEKKGASATEYGLVFGIFKLVSFLISPVYGKYMPVIGPLTVFKTGILVAGLSTTLFGLLDMVNDHTWFITLSFILRIAEAMGTCAIITATFSIVAIVYVETFARVFSLIEVLRGLGILLGPSLGGIFYELGGFQMPFYALGSSVFASGVFIFIFIPQIDEQKTIDKPAGSVLQVLKILPVSVNMFSLMILIFTAEFIMTQLEPHIRVFHLRPSMIGLVFLIQPLFYTLTSPFVAILCERGVCLARLRILGSLVVLVGITIIGPLHFIPLNPTLWMVCLGLALLGIAIALMFVPSMIECNVEIRKHGLPNDITTCGILSGILLSALAVGGFAGPSVAGILADFIGFRKGLYLLVAMNLLSVVVGSVVFCTTGDYDQIENSTSHSASSVTTHHSDLGVLSSRTTYKYLREDNDHSPIVISGIVEYKTVSSDHRETSDQ